MRQRKRAANQEAGGKAEQWKIPRRVRGSVRGDKAEQGEITEARQRKRAEIREGA